MVGQFILQVVIDGYDIIISVEINLQSNKGWTLKMEDAWIRGGQKKKRKVALIYSKSNRKNLSTYNKVETDRVRLGNGKQQKILAEIMLSLRVNVGQSTN